MDNLYHGIYRGIVINTSDPKNLNRLTVKVPQVTGESITNWAYPILGMPGYNKAIYGSFISKATQTSSTTSTYTVGLDTTESANGITLIDPATTGPFTSAIKFSYTGVYNVQLSAQFYSTVSGNNFVQTDLWLRQNGVDVPDSVGTSAMGAKNPYTVVSWNYILPIAAGDNLQLVWHVNTGGIPTSLQYNPPGSSPVQPSTPSVTISANMVGGFTPLAGEPVWVMFEGGDPNYPLWLGTF
jgi:hypothetical protein